MRSTLHSILLFVVLQVAHGQIRAQQDGSMLVDLPGGKMSVRNIFTSIEKATGLGVFYMGHTLDPDRQIMTRKGKLPFRDVLYLLGTDLGLEYSLENENIFIRQGVDTLLENEGYYTEVIVTDEDDHPLPHANVFLENTRKCFTTGGDGVVVVRTRKLPVTMFCTYVGRSTVRSVLTRDAVIRIRMPPKEIVLPEVHVSGFYDGYRSIVDNEEYPVNKSLLARRSSYIGRQELAEMPASNTLPGFLAGRVPGLLSRQTSGVPGAMVDVLIRGKMSILNKGSVLYVIDGVPFAPGNQSVSNIATGNAAGSLSPMSFISMDDIESIEVLKDADAAAIWGSRAANGAILLTTRRGTPGRPSLNVKIEKGVSMVTRRPHLMNTDDYRAMRLEALRNDGLTPDVQHAPDLVNWDTTRTTDWGKHFIGELANNLNLQTSLKGGTHKTSYFMGIHQYQETDVFPGHPQHDLTTLTGNFRHLAAGGRLTINANGLFGRDVNKQYVTDLTRLQFLAPNAPPLESKGDEAPWMPLLNNRYTARSYNYLAGGRGIYRVDSSLYLHFNTGISSVGVKEFSNIGDSTYHATTRYRTWIVEPKMEYRWRRAQWNTNMFAGGSWQGIRNTMGHVYTSDYVYQRLFTGLNLQWKDRFILLLDGCREGSNRWALGKQSNFGSAAFAWIFSKTPGFQQLLPFISFGKFRTSYGITGNDQIDKQYTVNGSMTWEKIIKQELALELGFFSNRLRIDAAWYRDHSLNQLLPDDVPATGGISALSSRPVIILNKGWEFNLTSILINNKDFSWTTSINASMPLNKLVSFPGLATTAYGKTLTEGKSLSSIRAFQYLGVDREKGLFQFRDLNGDKQLTDADKVPGKNLDVTCFGGILNTFTWHGWRLSTLIEARFQQGMDYQAAFYGHNPPGSTLSGLYSNMPAKFTLRWRNPGDQAVYQRLTTSMSSSAGEAIRSYLGSDAMLTNASFARVKSISLSWQLPEEARRRMHLHDLRFSLKGENLWTVTRYSGADPETQNINTLPPMKTVVAGVEISF